MGAHRRGEYPLLKLHCVKSNPGQPSQCRPWRQQLWHTRSQQANMEAESGAPLWFVEYEQRVTERIDVLTARVGEQERELADMKQVSQRLLAELHAEQRQNEQLKARLEASKKPHLEVKKPTQASPPSRSRVAPGVRSPGVPAISVSPKEKELRKGGAERGAAQNRGARPAGPQKERLL